MLVVTIIVIALLFILSYIIFDKDLLAPPTAVALVFLFGSFCTFYNETRWGLEFSIKSTGLIAAGIIATMLGGIIGVWLCSFPKLGKSALSHKVTRPQEIKISPWKTWVVIAVQLVALYMIFSHIRRLTGFSSWMQAVKQYRDLTGKNRDVEDLSLRMSFMTRNLAQLSLLFGVMYAYIIGNNLIASKKKISINWLPVLLYSITTFIQGARSNMLRLWMVAVITAFTVHKRSIGWRSSKDTRRIIRKIAISVLAVGVLFVAVREIVGRTADSDPFYYVTFYAGSPIAILDQLWVNPISKPEVWGQRTFFYLNTTTTAFFGWPGKYNFYYDFFRSPNGSIIGNAPTAFRPAYVEFGFWGFFLLMTLFGIFYMVLYCKCREKSGSNPIEIRLIMYAYIAYTFFMYFYSTFFDFLSHTIIKFMIELLVIRWFLVSFQVKQGGIIKLRYHREAFILEK